MQMHIGADGDIKRIPNVPLIKFFFCAQTNTQEMDQNFYKTVSFK